MTTSKFAATAFISLAALAAGSAFASDNLPAFGEAPFANPTSTVSNVSRASVRAEVQQGARPDSGEVSQIAAPAGADDHLTRAEVRAVARQNGHQPRSGEMS